jgi:hypothetical protein
MVRFENQPLLPLIVFQEAISSNSKWRKSKTGNAMNYRLGEVGLPFNSVEGHITQIVNGKSEGDTVFRRITPIAYFLNWAEVCEAETGELVLIEDSL